MEPDNQATEGGEAGVTPFCLSTLAERTGLLLVLFVSLLLMLALLFITFGKERNRPSWAAKAAVFLLFFIILIILCAEHSYISNGFPLIFRSPISISFLWCAAIALGLYGAGGIIVRWHNRYRVIDRNSIKEAMDSLPAAVCYFTEKGVVRLCNLQMHRLFYALSQCDLQSLSELYAGLAACDAHTGIIKLSDDEPVYLFPDGKAWLFTENKVYPENGRAYTETIFYDVTELYEKRLEIQAQTEKLRELGKNIRRLSENVVAMTKEEEMLSFKTALHDRMGAGLMAARQVLLQNRPTKEMDALIRDWQRSVAFVKQDNDALAGRGELSGLMRDAEAIGVDICVDGELPQDPDASGVFLGAMRESLTNCVRHANATELRASITHNEKGHTLVITNNGRAPKEQIIPRGGLANLAKRVSHIGGTIDIQSLPEFKLTITIPIERGFLQ